MDGRKTFIAALIGVVLLGATTVAAAQGAAPRNLRVTGVTDWTVGLAWDRPSGNPASYVVQCSNGRTMSVPESQTEATFSNGFDYIRTYSFRVFAISSNGNWSSASNSVGATLLTDTTPPTQPEVSAASAGPTHIVLAWSCFDACPTLRFDIFMNDALLYGQVAGNSKVIVMLRPDRPYTFRVRARDLGGNWSPISEAFKITTPKADKSDYMPPKPPPGLWAAQHDLTEVTLYWSDSDDNVTAPDFIEYHVYLNGIFDGAMVGIYRNQYTLYLTPGIVNSLELYAFDEAGNRSIPSTLIFDLR